MVEKLESLHEDKRLDLASSLEMFHQIRSQYPGEYTLYELPHIAATIVVPLLKAELSGWQVLDAPFKHKITFTEWRKTLYLSGKKSLTASRLLTRRFDSIVLFLDRLSSTRGRPVLQSSMGVVDAKCEESYHAVEYEKS